MTDKVTRAATAEEIAAFEAKKEAGAIEPNAPVVEFAKNDKAREKTIPLEFPVTIDGVLVEKIVCRRLSGRHLMELEDQNPVELVTGYSVEVIQALDGDDAAAVMEAATDFLPRSIREPLKAARDTAMRKAEQALINGRPTPPTSPTT